MLILKKIIAPNLTLYNYKINKLTANNHWHYLINIWLPENWSKIQIEKDLDHWMHQSILIDLILTLLKTYHQVYKDQEHMINFLYTKIEI